MCAQPGARSTLLSLMQDVPTCQSTPDCSGHPHPGIAGIKTVIDLRDRVETNRVPDPLAASFAYLNLPLRRYGAAIDSWAQDLQPRQTYCMDLESCRAEIGAILGALVVARHGATLIHCTAGKDRTGMLAALILAAAGVAPAAVAADYAASATQLSGLIAVWKA